MHIPTTHRKGKARAGHGLWLCASSGMLGWQTPPHLSWPRWPPLAALHGAQTSVGLTPSLTADVQVRVNIIKKRKPSPVLGTAGEKMGQSWGPTWSPSPGPAGARQGPAVSVRS